jgi:hypothetical protein
LRGHSVGFLFVLGAAALGGCGARGTGPPSISLASAEPHWESALGPAPDLLVVVRPRALRKDTVYGPLVGRAIELAREHTPIVASTGALDAMEDADEVIVGARDSGPNGAGDMVVVVRGVRANVDPANIVDELGHPLWAAGPNGSATSVTELLRTRADNDTPSGDPTAVDASLFELPGRTWVIATGAARARARDAFARPGPVGSDPLGVPSSSLAVLQLRGAALVSRVRALRPPGLLSPLGNELATVTVVLTPGNDGIIRATLSYRDERAVALADTTLRETINALSRAKPAEYAWLRSATVQTSRCCVVVTTPLPRPLSNGEFQRDPRSPAADASHTEESPSVGPKGQSAKPAEPGGGSSSKIPL